MHGFSYEKLAIDILKDFEFHKDILELDTKEITEDGIFDLIGDGNVGIEVSSVTDGISASYRSHNNKVIKNGWGGNYIIINAEPEDEVVKKT